MPDQQLHQLGSQLMSKALAGIVLGVVVLIAVLALRTWFERWIDRKIRRWKGKRQEKRHGSMSDDQILDAPKCPQCGGTMTLRTARKGANQGEQFWGCDQFPKCKGTRQASHN